MTQFIDPQNLPPPRGQDRARREREARDARLVEQVIERYGGVARPPLVRFVELRPVEIVPMTALRAEPAPGGHVAVLDGPTPWWRDPPPAAGAPSPPPPESLTTQHVIYERKQWVARIWRDSGRATYDEERNVLTVFGYYIAYRYDVWVASGQPLPEAQTEQRVRDLERLETISSIQDTLKKLRAQADAEREAEDAERTRLANEEIIRRWHTWRAARDAAETETEAERETAEGDGETDDG